MTTSLLSKKRLLRSESQKPTDGDATGNETDPETMREEFGPTQSHGQPVPGHLIDEREYGETVTLSARMAELIRPYRDRTFSVNQRWTLLVAINDRRVLPAKEAIVPQAVLTVQLRPLHRPLAQPLTSLLRHILKTHKETVAVDHRVRNGASQIQTHLGTRAGHIAHARHPRLNQRLMKPAAISLTRSKLCDGKKAPRITVVLRSSLRLWYRTFLILLIGRFLQQTSPPRRWCRTKSL